MITAVGTGIGGGLVLNRRIHGSDRPAAAEIGHLRPHLDRPRETVESRSAGPGIARAAQGTLRARQSSGQSSADVEELLNRCGGEIEALTTKILGEAAVSGNALARGEYRQALQTLGWAIAQVITIVAPDVVVVGGGVSLVGDEVFFAPLRAAVREYVFGPQGDAWPVVPAALGESVVVHGALALAQTAS